MDEFEFPGGFLKVFEDLEAIDPPDSHTGTIRSAVAVDRCELKQPCVSPELMAEVPNLTRPVSPRYRILDNDGALAEWDDEINRIIKELQMMYASSTTNLGVAPFF